MLVDLLRDLPDAERRRARGTRPSAARRRRTRAGAATRAARSPRRSGRRSSPADHLEVRVLERRAHDPDLVDVLARLDQLAHDPRDVLARGLRERARAAPGVDLDAARVRELRRRARPRPPRRARSSPRGRTPARPRDSRCEFSSTATPRERSSSSSSRTVRRPAGSSALVGSSSSSSFGVADHRLRDPEPLLHALRHRADAPVGHLAEPDELQQLAPLRRAAAASPRASGAAAAARPRSASPGSGTARRGSRASGWRPRSRPVRRRPARCRSTAARARTRSSPASTCPPRWARAGPTSSPSPTVRSTPFERLVGAVALAQVMDGECLGHARRQPGRSGA